MEVPNSKNLEKISKITIQSIYEIKMYIVKEWFLILDLGQAETICVTEI